MKKEFSAKNKPEKITELYPGELNDSPCLDVITDIPSPLFVVTGYKSNGKENACLQSWSAFTGCKGGFVCVLSSVFTGGHMYKSLKETGVCVLNFPSKDIYALCAKTIENNQFDTDEITASGLTAEKAVTVNAPRIAECFLNIECEFLWERPIQDGDEQHAVVALKVTNICMDSDHYDNSKLGRLGKTGYLYNVGAGRNPDTGEALQWTEAYLKLFE